MSPHTFATTRLGVTSWAKMSEIFDAVEAGHRKILVRSCNGAGKTTAIAALCNWKLVEFPNSIVLTTASSWTQVTRALWGEIRRQANHGKLYKDKEMTATQIKLDEKHYAVGISPTMPENAQGFHAEHMLIVVDEATGVDREIIDALWGNATSKDAQMVMIYNPIDPASYPFEAEETGQWHVITISAFEHPNVLEGREVIPGAVTREWIEDRVREWSYEVRPEDITDPEQVVSLDWLGTYYKKTLLVATRICGEWPLDGGEGFIDLGLIRNSYIAEARPGEMSLGVDVARSGSDRTVFAKFNGNVMVGCDVVWGKDLMFTANRVKQLYDEGYTTIGIDDTGIGGGVCDRLKELGIPHFPVNFSSAAKKFLPGKDLANTRSEMYFVLMEELKRNELVLAQDRELEQELSAARLEIDSASGAYRLEPKELIKRRLGRSPDKADAVAIARYAVRLQKYSRRKVFY